MRTRYESAQDAFASLRPDYRPVKKRRVAKLVRNVAKVFHVDAPRGAGASCLINWVFKNNNQACGKVFTKSVKVVQVRGSNDICIFSDVYYLNHELLDTLVETCVAAGLPASGFEKEYPMLEFSNGYRPEIGAGWLCEGYARLYRGKLAGVVFGPSSDS